MNMIGITTISSIPSRCLDCAFKLWHVDKGFVCQFLGMEKIETKGRLCDCPLVEITVEGIEEQDEFFKAFMNQEKGKKKR